MEGRCDQHGLAITTTDGKCLECFSIKWFKTVDLSVEEWADLMERIIGLESELTAANEEIEKLKWERRLELSTSMNFESQLTAEREKVEKLREAVTSYLLSSDPGAIHKLLADTEGK